MNSDTKFKIKMAFFGYVIFSLGLMQAGMLTSVLYPNSWVVAAMLFNIGHLLVQILFGVVVFAISTMWFASALDERIKKANYSEI